MTQFGDDSRSDTRPIYCYIIQQIDLAGSPAIFLTNHADELEIEGLPARYNGDNPQTFAPASITHGPIRREGNFDKSSFNIQALTRDIANVSRYALTGAVPRIQVDVVKVNPGNLVNGSTALWGQDTILTQTGLIATFNFQGFGLSLECVPAPLFSNQEIPRWRFSRICNHQLYGPGCGVNPAGFSYTYAISELYIDAQQIRVIASLPDGYFRQGVMTHVASGLRIPVFQNYASAGVTAFVVGQWVPDMQVGDVVTIRAGCDHLFATCRDKFSNGANFGGFSQIPSKNISSHGL